MARPSKLPAPAEDLVLNELRRSGEALGAYRLLERVKRFGIRNSPVVYRALRALVTRGAVHRVRELNAFVACDCTPDHRHALSVLTVCRDCRRVEELHDHAVIDRLESLRDCGVGLTDRGVIELPVTCRACAGRRFAPRPPTA